MLNEVYRIFCIGCMALFVLIDATTVPRPNVGYVSHKAFNELVYEKAPCSLPEVATGRYNPAQVVLAKFAEALSGNGGYVPPGVDVGCGTCFRIVGNLGWADFKVVTYLQGASFVLNEIGVERAVMNSIHNQSLGTGTEARAVSYLIMPCDPSRIVVARLARSTSAKLDLVVYGAGSDIEQLTVREPIDAAVSTVLVRVPQTRVFTYERDDGADIQFPIEISVDGAGGELYTAVMEELDDRIFLGQVQYRCASVPVSDQTDESELVESSRYGDDCSCVANNPLPRAIFSYCANGRWTYPTSLVVDTPLSHETAVLGAADVTLSQFASIDVRLPLNAPIVEASGCIRLGGRLIVTMSNAVDSGTRYSLFRSGSSCFEGAYEDANILLYSASGALVEGSQCSVAYVKLDESGTDVLLGVEQRSAALLGCEDEIPTGDVVGSEASGMAIFGAVLVALMCVSSIIWLSLIVYCRRRGVFIAGFD